MSIGCENQVLTRGMKERRPRHRSESSQLLFVRPVEVHRENFCDRSTFVEMAVADLLAVMREKWATVITGFARELLQAAPISIHDKDVGHDRRVALKNFSRLGIERLGKATAIGGKHNEFAIRGIAALGIVTLGLSQLPILLGLQIVFIELISVVVIPSITPLGSRLAGRKFVLLLLDCIRVSLGRGIHHLGSIRVDPGTSRLALPRRDSFHVSGLEIEQVNLIEGICRLAFALEDQLLAIATVVPLPCPLAIKGQLPWLGEVTSF